MTPTALRSVPGRRTQTPGSTHHGTKARFPVSAGSRRRLRPAGAQAACPLPSGSGGDVVADAAVLLHEQLDRGCDA